MLRNQKGFTIMELMIVIVIIGVLAAIGVPAYNGYVDKARTAACNANKRTIETAAGMYWADKGITGESETIETLKATDSDLKGYLTNIDQILCPLDNGESKVGYDVTVEKSGKVTVKCNKHDATP